MKVLVTGASSVLIQKVCANLLKNDYHFTGVSRAQQNIAPNIYSDWISADLSSQINLINFSKYKTIIHAAACTHAFSFEAYKKINVDITKELVTNAKKSGVEKFIFISSRAAVENGGWYAETKLSAEKIVEEHFPNAIIIRPSEIYGGTKQEGIDALIEKVKKNKFIFYPSGIEDKMYPIQNDDASKYIAEIISNNQSGIFTINGHDGVTLKSLFQALSKSLNKKPILISIPIWILSFVCYLQKFLQLKIGVYPDQLKRLKARKKYTLPPTYVRTIKEIFS